MNSLQERYRRILIGLTIMLAAGLLGACGTYRTVSRMLVGSDPPEQLSIAADPEVNQGYPVAVDVVMVADKDIFATLSKLRAAEWFAGKRDYQRQYQKSIQVLSWEVVPGQSVVEKVRKELDGDLVGTLLFADYIGDKTFRANVTGYTQVHLELKPDDFSVSTR